MLHKYSKILSQFIFIVSVHFTHREATTKCEHTEVMTKCEHRDAITKHEHRNND